MGDAFFEVFLTDGGEAKVCVEGLEVGLGADADGLTRVEFADFVDGNLHDELAEASAAVGLGGEDSADGGFGVFFAGVDDAQVGGDLAVMQGGQMPAMGVVFVRVRAADVLLGDEHGLAGEGDGVELGGGEALQSSPVEFEVAHWLASIRSFCRPVLTNSWCFSKTKSALSLISAASCP